MSEEMNKRESALSDAELETVSGAEVETVRGTIQKVNDREMRVRTICGMCGSSHCSATPYSSLEAYLKEHGNDSVGGPFSCPYYKW